jgi:hypothetical protein
MKKYLDEDIIHFRTPPQMTNDIARIAEENMISKSAVCRHAIKEYLLNKKGILSGQILG